MPTPDPTRQYAELLMLLDRRRETHKLEHYEPYEFQRKWHNARGFKTEKPAAQKLLMAANGTGKTWCGAMEVAIHVTGKYPDWWKGKRFTGPTVWMIGGKTNELTRDVNQKLLFGDPSNPAALGTGSIPIDCIGKRTMKPGVPNAFDTVLVKHATGRWSKLMFRAYEQGPAKHMGIRVNGGWLDEEPPVEIWSQYLRATISMDAVLNMTFTPENGMTEVVTQFMESLAEGQALVGAAWEDAKHLVDDKGEWTSEAKQLWAGFQPHEREMRSKGIPMMGSGLVFPFNEDAFVIDPIEIPKYWPRIIGIDFGSDHPFGAAELAWDRDADTVYVTKDYRESRAIPAIHAAAVKPWGNWPVAWPHDGLNTEKGTGRQLRSFYIDEGLLMLPEKATNPPQSGQEEGEGGNSREAAILSMYERFETGRIKVFRTCKNFLEERRTYHRKDGKIVDIRDDAISAVRYAHMMLRHARTETVRRRKVAFARGASNW